MVATLASGVHLQMRNAASVYGEGGAIHLDDPWKSAPGCQMRLERPGQDPEIFSLGCTGTELYAHEADSVADYLSAGECPYMTVEDTLANMHCLDQMRASCGLHFEAEATS